MNDQDMVFVKKDLERSSHASCAQQKRCVDVLAFLKGLHPMK